MDIELEETSPSCRQKLAGIANDSSLQSAANSDGDSSEHADDNRIDSFESFTVDEEKAIVKKLDRHLVLFIAFIYMLSFLDRSSKSNQDL